MGSDLFLLACIFLILLHLLYLLVHLVDRLAEVLRRDEELAILEVQIRDVIIANAFGLYVFFILIHLTRLRQVHDREDILAVGSLQEGILGKQFVLDEVVEDFVELGDLEAAPLLLELVVGILRAHDLLHRVNQRAQRPDQPMNGREDAAQHKEVDDDEADPSDNHGDIELLRQRQVEVKLFDYDAQGHGVVHPVRLSLVCRPEVQVVDYHGLLLAVALEVDSLRRAGIL